MNKFTVKVKEYNEWLDSFNSLPDAYDDWLEEGAAFPTGNTWSHYNISYNQWRELHPFNIRETTKDFDTKEEADNYAWQIDNISRRSTAVVINNIKTEEEITEQASNYRAEQVMQSVDDDDIPQFFTLTDEQENDFTQIEEEKEKYRHTDDIIKNARYLCAVLGEKCIIEQRTINKIMLQTNRITVTIEDSKVT